MQATPVQHPIESRTRSSHDELEKRGLALRRMLTSPPPRDGRLLWLGHLCLDLSDFIEQVARHFEYEETQGPFDEILSRRPDLVSRIHQLEGNHRAILLGFERVCATLGNTPIQEVTDCILDLLAQLEAHEAAESELMLAAWADDLGTGG